MPCLIPRGCRKRRVSKNMCFGKQISQSKTFWGRPLVCRNPKGYPSPWKIFGYGSIPISGMNIHLPAILGFTRYQGFDPSPFEKHVLDDHTSNSWNVFLHQGTQQPETRGWLPTWDTNFCNHTYDPSFVVDICAESSVFSWMYGPDALVSHDIPFTSQVVSSHWDTLWLFNIAMENGPFIDGLPIKNGWIFPWQTVSHNQMVVNRGYED